MGPRMERWMIVVGASLFGVWFLVVVLALAVESLDAAKVAFIALPILVVLGVIIIGVVSYRKRQKEMYDALFTESCLLCDATNNLDVRGENDYHCYSCGYDTHFAYNPLLTQRLATFRDVKNALSAFEEGAESLDYARFLSGADIAVSTADGPNMSKYDVLNEANNRMMDGLKMIRDLFQTRPELLDLPVPGANITHGESLRDVFVDDIFSAINVHSKISESQAEVSHYIEKIHKLKGALREEIIRLGREKSRPG